MEGKRTFRKEKLEFVLRKEINLFLRNDVYDTNLQFLSITKVELTNDFSHAKVYWDTFDESKQQYFTKAVEKMVPAAKKKLSTVLKLRRVPSLKFIYDTQVVSEERIVQLLKE